MNKIRLTLFAFFASFALTLSALAQYPGTGGSGQLPVGQGTGLPLWMSMIGDCAFAANGAIICTETNGVPFYKNLPTPTSAGDAATKQYVDSVASGIVIHQQVRLGTTAALPSSTYSNGSSGVGATITATANGALTIDGTATSNADRVLIKNQTSAADNGIYVVTSSGNAGSEYILTRSTDANTAGTANPNEIGLSSYALITAGSLNANTGWTVNSPVTTIGSSAINFVQFSGSGGVSSLGGMNGALLCGPGMICANGTVSPVLSNNIAGLILSNDGVSPTTVLDVEAGLAADSTNAANISIGAFTKSTVARGRPGRARTGWAMV